MMKHKENKLSLEHLFVLTLLVVFGGIVFQAPISVGFGVLLPHYSLIIKAWAEILLTIASGFALILLYQKRQLRLLKDPLILLIILFVLIHLISLGLFWQGSKASISGLIIDLRYVVFFGLVYVVLKLNAGYRSIFIKVGVAGALVVLIFALLQVFILPADILKYIGYSTKTIVPYLTVDQNQSYIRINSTLRGPNPVGAYALIVLTLLTSVIVKKRPIPKNKTQLVMAVLAVGGIVALWVSYSRSALIGAVIAVLIVIVSALYGRVSKKIWALKLVIVAVLVVVALSLGGKTFISNIALHDNPNGGSATKSDQGHLSSLSDGFNLMLHQPLGAGIGSTGSASLYTKSPLIIENQYLFIAHEAGWLGLISFLIVFVWVLRRLWQKRQDWLAVGVFASGIGLAIIGLLLPVWVDDTISIIWWGLAAVALGSKTK
jgi:hypothetical protein